MVKKIGEYKVPFNSVNGDQLHYANQHYGRNVEWKDNFKFEDTIKIVEMSRGRSSAFFQAKSTITDKKYTVFMRDLLDMMLYTTIDKGVVSGTFTFRKRGQNYGIAILEI